MALRAPLERKMHAGPSHYSSLMSTVRAIQSFFGPGLHPVFLVLTGLGTSVVLWSLLALYYWLVDPRFGRRLAITFAASILANHVLKGAFGTQRPYVADPTLASVVDRRTGGGAGFPSGHSMNAATFYLAFAFRYRRPLLWLAALLLMAGVGLSRLYLGVHLPEDVGGGFILGALFAGAAGWWSGPPAWPLKRRIQVPLAMVAGLAVAVLTDPLSCGLLLGSLLARPDFEPPRDGKGRAVIVGGGIVLVALLGGLLLWLPEKLAPGLVHRAPVAFLIYMVIAWVGLDVWPRWAARSWGSGRHQTLSVRD
jgi:membrane-associated phospholipid phosphatase